MDSGPACPSSSSYAQRGPCQEPPRTLYEPSLNAEPRQVAWRSRLNRVDPLISVFRSNARRLDREATQAAGAVIVNSQFVLNVVSRIYAVAPQVSYLGVDTAVFHPDPGIERQDYVLSVGTIQPHKGFDFLIRSLGQVPSASRPALRLIGNSQDRDYRMYLETLAGRERVSLQIELGVPLDVLVRRYSEARLLLYAPHNEPFGLVPLEAMACGTPIVAVAEGGVRESVVSEYTGLLVSGTWRSLQRQCNAYLPSRKLAATFGLNGRKHTLEKWTWDRSVALLESHLSACGKIR